MFKRLLLVLGAAAFTSPAGADDALAPETVAAVKKATVFIRVEGDGWSATGSGFVVTGDDKALLIATNHHVAVPNPPPGGRAGKPPAVSVVFDSGTKAQREYPATVAGSDADRDLAVLRVAGVKAPPPPILPTDVRKLTETMPVYTFGFPFGKGLDLNEGFPAITVGKASISSLRNDPDGDLAMIQIDGNLNPGNSGGPVVDAKGKLVGVAVSVIKDSRGIAFIVPADHLGQLMRGRVGELRFSPPKKGFGPLTARVEVELLDPTASLRRVTARYLVVPPNAKRPTASALDREPGSKVIELKVANGVGVAEIPLAAAEGDILVQVAAEAPGKPVATTRVRAYPLAPPDFTGPPATGWKEYTPADKSFVMWVPEKPARQADEARVSRVGGEFLRVSTLDGRTADGLTYEAKAITLPFAFLRVSRVELFDLFRGAIVEDLDGRITESKAAESGNLRGAEYVITAGRVTTRVRMYVLGTRVYIVQVTGTAAQVAGTEAETLLSAYRLPDNGLIARPGPVAPPPGLVGSLPGKSPAVIGGNGPPPFGGAPFFKDLAPKDGLLVGVEVVLGRPYADELILSVLPLYRVGKVGEFGKQFGTATDGPVTLKAKPGYAVGGITAKARNVCDGFSLTFMKVTNGKLDPRDTYESEWVGWNGAGPALKVLSDGVPVVGFVGRANTKDVTGIGLVFQGQETAEAVAATVAPVREEPTRPVRTNPVVALPPGKEPTILGGAFDPKFQDVAPAGGLLIGFEIGTAPAFGFQMTRSARPIYRADNKESFGQQYGTQLRDVVTIKAKAGYAVGAISVMHGLGFDGFSVTFMKVTDGKLDPTDSYESEYVGSGQKKPLTKIGGDGTPVVGIVGKSNRTDMTGMGLLFQGQ